MPEDKEAKFRQMCVSHDLTYAYSDDHRYWVAGERTLKAIKAFAETMDDEVVKRIWDEVVDTKLKAGHCEEWYWKI